MSDSHLPLIDFETAKNLGLDRQEWNRIAERLGRSPNEIEARIFAQLWSEEVGLKSSSAMLKTMDRAVDKISPIPGVFGGELIIDESLHLISSTVSNNTAFRKDPATALPLAINAATLAIAARGAKPLGVSSFFYTSEIDKADAHDRFQKSVYSLSDFLRHSGLLALETNWYVNELYAGNAMCGATVVATKEQNSLLAAAEPGDPIIMVGAKTGDEQLSRAGKETLDNEKSTIPYPDPFLQYRIAQALSELHSNGLLSAAIALHYGGLSIAAVRLCESISGVIDLDLNRVPHKLSHVSAENLLFSESSGRILLCAPKAELRKISNIFSKWEVPQQTCGSVSQTRGLEINYNHHIIADIPVNFAIAGATEKEFNVVKFPPMLKTTDSATKAPTTPKKYQKKENDEWSLIRSASKKVNVANDDFPEPNSLADAWVDLLANINLSSKRQLTELYDEKVGGLTETDSNPEGKLIRYLKSDGSSVSIATASASCPLYTGADPYLGMTHSVALAMRRLAALGTKPIGLSFQLHYGSPDKYKEMCDLSESIRALGDATKHWSIPILDADVSLGNGSDAYPLLATPQISMFGMRKESISDSFSPYPNDGDSFLIIGTTAEEYLCSEYSKYLHRSVNSSGLPNIDFDYEAKAACVVSNLIEAKLLTACRAIGPGGIGYSLATSTLGGEKPKGASLEISTKVNREDAQLFGESSGRYILFASPEKLKEIETKLNDETIKVEGRGKVEGREFKITGSVECSMPVATAYRIWNQATDRAIG